MSTRPIQNSKAGLGTSGELANVMWHEVVRLCLHRYEVDQGVFTLESGTPRGPLGSDRGSV